MHSIAEFYGQRLNDVYKVNAAVNFDLKKLFGAREDEGEEEEKAQVNQKYESWMTSSNEDMSMNKLKTSMKNVIQNN